MMTGVVAALLGLVVIELGAVIFLLCELLQRGRTRTTAETEDGRVSVSRENPVNPLYKMTRQVRRAGDR